MTNIQINQIDPWEQSWHGTTCFHLWRQRGVVYCEGEALPSSTIRESSFFDLACQCDWTGTRFTGSVSEHRAALRLKPSVELSNQMKNHSDLLKCTTLDKMTSEAAAV